MSGDEFARFGGEGGQGLILEPARRAGSHHGALDCNTREALDILIDRLRQTYATTPRRRAENTAELEPSLSRRAWPILARRAEFRERTKD